MAVLLLYNHGDSYTVQQLHESTQIKMVRNSGGGDRQVAELNEAWTFQCEQFTCRFEKVKMKKMAEIWREFKCHQHLFVCGYLQMEMRLMLMCCTCTIE